LNEEEKILPYYLSPQGRVFFTKSESDRSNLVVQNAPRYKNFKIWALGLALGQKGFTHT
jgi:hypothetical protein